MLPNKHQNKSTPSYKFVDRGFIEECVISSKNRAENFVKHRYAIKNIRELTIERA